MNPTEVNIEKIAIEDNYINYGGKRLVIRTDWLPTYYMQQFKTLKVMLTKEEDILKILHDIDTKVGEHLPDKCNQTMMVKKYEEKEYAQPKFKFSKVYDEDKKEITLKALEKPNIECRYVFSVSPIKRFKNYYGCHLKCLQIQVRQKQREELPCMFDD